MNLLETFNKLADAIFKLGLRRLALLATIGIGVFAVVIGGGWYLTRPDFDLLYAGLDREDVTRIGATLQEAGIPFDVSSDGTSVYAARGQTASARMQLAEKGLPRGGGAGYELFDKIGSLGLTSFMQNVTRVRALEGELARTIQTMRGIKAARVHIVMPEDGTFRRNAQPASASVVIRGELLDGARSAFSIRHLIAAAVGGLTVDQVTVLDTDGTLLASGEDTEQGGPSKLLGLERTVSSSLQDKIRRTLAPYLSSQNMQVSVVARLNTDQRQIKEVIFNPDARVERSVRVVKENQTAQNSSNQAATSVERNIPQDQAKSADGKNSNEENQRREETTNYEISSKTVTTTSGGYLIENLSIAVLLNRGAIATALGSKATPEDIDRRVSEIEALIVSAAGLRKDRGDTIKLTAVEFPGAKDVEPEQSTFWSDLILHQSGTLMKALTMVAVAAIVLAGLKPALRSLAPAGGGYSEMEPASSLESAPMPMALPTMTSEDIGAMFASSMDDDVPDFLSDLSANEKNSPQRRLQHLVDHDEERAAAILKKWIHSGAGA